MRSGKECCLTCGFVTRGLTQLDYIDGFVAGTQQASLVCSSSQFVIVFELVQGCGLDPALYGGHSLRRGGATWAFECGVHPVFIQGDWQSDSWLLYVGLSEEQKRLISRKMQEGISGI